MIPHLARSAEHLYVFQRTPSTIDVRGDEPTDPEWVKTLEAGLAGRAAAQLPHRGVRGLRPRPAGPDLRRLDRDQPQPGRAPGRHRRLGRAGRSGEVPGTAGDPGLPGDGTAAPPHRPDRRGPATPLSRSSPTTGSCASGRVSVTSTCRPSTAPTSRSSMSRTPRASSASPRPASSRSGVEHEVDCIIFASGFEITTDLDRRLGIEPFAGRDGLSLYDYWAKGYRTLHGITSHGFPNLFCTGFIQGGVTASTTLMFDQQADHIAYIISEALARGAHDRGTHRGSGGAVVPDRQGRPRSTTHLRPGVHARATTTTRASRTGGRTWATRTGSASTLWRTCCGLARLGRDGRPRTEGDRWLSSGSTAGWP